MDLVSESPTELYFHRTPLKIQILAGVFFIVGLVLIMTFGWKTEITCNCAQAAVPQRQAGKQSECGGWCNITQTNLWMFSERRIPTKSIRSAILEGSAAAYRVVLVLARNANLEESTIEDDGEIGGEQYPLVHYYSHGRYLSRNALASKINTVIHGFWEVKEEGTVTVLHETQDDRWLTYIVGLIFMSLILVVILLTKKEVCLIDKEEGVLALIRTTAFQRIEEVYALNEISLVELHRNTQDRKTEYKVFFEVEPSRTSKNSITTSSSLLSGGTVLKQVIIETGNRWISMCEEGSYQTEEQAQRICQRIRKFLGIPSLDDIMREKKKT